jgi:hypothetical protein
MSIPAAGFETATPVFVLAKAVHASDLSPLLLPSFFHDGGQIVAA